jgi:hypothetical protein
MQALLSLPLAAAFALTMPAMSTPLQYGAAAMLPEPGDAFSFDGDVVVKHEKDMNWDGTPDRVYHYRRGSIQRVDFDLDLDGEFDLRATYEEPAEGASNLQYRLVKIENEKDYRFMPSATVATYPNHNEFYLAGPPPRYEALIDGAWRESFTIDLPVPVVQYDPDAAKGVMSFVCQDGAAVSLTTEAQPDVSEEYQQTLFKNGKVSRYVTGTSPERIHQEITYTYGEDSRSVTRTDRDGDGAFDYTYTQKLPHPGAIGLHEFSRARLFYNHRNIITTRIKIDGQWTGTFVDNNVRYVDGRMTEVYARGTQRVVQRYEYDKQGQLHWAERDRDGDGEFDYRSNADGTMQKLVNGRWVGDFEINESMAGTEMQYTYRDGRLVRYEGRFPKERRHTVFESPEPGVHIVKESGVFRPSLDWYYYAVEADGAESQTLLRSAHDIDADDKPDVFVDYQTLTITNTKPADWSQ